MKKVAIEKLGFDFCKDACAECDESSLTSQQTQALNKNGIEWECDGSDLDLDLYFEIYLKIIKLGNPNFVYEDVSLPHINIGAYGLFYVG